MPLQAALSSFKSTVEDIYANNKNTPAICAQKIATAVKDWAVQGVPMTTHPTTLMGSGGIDTAAPGQGLAAAKTKFQLDIQEGFRSRSNTAAKAAKVFTDAHMAFFSQAQIMTIVTAVVTTPPAPYSGTGQGGIDKSTAGPGLAAALPTYISALTAIFANVSKSNSVEQFAKKLADASYNFLSSAVISTVDAGVSGAGGSSTSGTIA